MANADTDRNDLQREIGAGAARVERLESLRQRFVDTGPSLALIGANIAVSLFAVVQLMGLDGRLSEVEGRVLRFEQQLGEMKDGLAHIGDGLETLLER